MSKDIFLINYHAGSNKCGIAVNLLNPKEISNAINYVMPKFK